MLSHHSTEETDDIIALEPCLISLVSGPDGVRAIMTPSLSGTWLHIRARARWNGMINFFTFIKDMDNGVIYHIPICDFAHPISICTGDNITLVNNLIAEHIRCNCEDV
jgi:hypothetical protein